jgi:hypothetical protein
VSTSRPAGAVVGALLIALSLAACGSSNSGTGTNANAGTGASQPGGARRGFLQDPKVVACLKKQGVTLPNRPQRGNGGAPGGQNGQNGQPPSGQGRPNGGQGSAQFQKLRAALQKCGVNFQGRPPNGQPPQGGQGTTSTTTSAS